MDKRGDLFDQTLFQTVHLTNGSILFYSHTYTNNANLFHIVCAKYFKIFALVLRQNVGDTPYIS